MKRCSVCKEEKPLEEFVKDSTKPDGRRTRCYPCYNKARRGKIKPPINTLSLGAGVQSTALLLMSMHGELPPLDYAIFADTGMEPHRVYDNLDWLEKISTIPIIRVQSANLYEQPFSMPLFLSGGGMLRRQCTKNLKIQPVQKKVWELVGKTPLARVNLNIGISYDEAHRMSDSRVNYITNVYPLVDNKITRHDCFHWMAEKGYPEPPRSACIVCPFQSSTEWMKHSDEELLWAIQFDKDIRDGGPQTHTIESQMYLHQQRKPLTEVRFTIKDDDGFGNECSGHCGV